MSYTVIDKKTETHSYGLGAEKVETTLWLVYMGDKKVGIKYDSHYSGVKNGHVTGGPHQVTKDGTIVVNESPKVEVIISNFSNANNHATMHVKITVDSGIWGVGEQTIFNQTLAGNYGEQAGWLEMFSQVKEAEPA